MSDRYDIGLINDFGGGNVEWWQDYIRAEVERANEFHADIHEQNNAEIERLTAENERLKRLADYIDCPAPAYRGQSAKECCSSGNCGCVFSEFFDGGSDAD